MTLNLDNKGLKSITNEFELFFIDIWGVVHNGIKLFQNSINVLNELERNKKEYVLLTNAPRPNSDVIKFLKKMGLDDDKCQKVYTSGEAALKHLNSKWKNSKFFHIGPPRDFNLFKMFEKNKVKNTDEAELLLCTGLFDNYDKDLDFYKNLLKSKIDRLSDKFELIKNNKLLFKNKNNDVDFRINPTFNNSKKFSTWILKKKIQKPNFFSGRRIHLIIDKMLLSSKKGKKIQII